MHEDAHGLERARWMLAKLGGDADPDMPEAGPGRCHDCGGDVLHRWRIGLYAVCRGCLTRRRSAS